MDIVAHGFWTFVIVYMLSKLKLTSKYFDTNKKKLAAVIAGFGIDLLFAPQFIYIFTNIAINGRNFPELANEFPSWFYTWYYINHNYFFIALIAIFLYFRYRGYLVPITFALALHVTADIFTHKNVFQLKPFWPIQQETFQGLVSWGNPVFFKWSWTILVASIALIFIHIQHDRRSAMISKIKMREKADRKKNKS